MRQAPQDSEGQAVTSIPSTGDGGHASPVAALALRPLKGRKRFTADLGELNAHPELIARSGRWSVKSMFPSFSVRLFSG